MQSLKMSLNLGIRSKVNWVQNNTITDKHSSCHYIPIKFTETIQYVLKVLVAFITQPRKELSMCPCKVKTHLSANFAKSKNVMLTLYFVSVS